MEPFSRLRRLRRRNPQHSSKTPKFQTPHPATGQQRLPRLRQVPGLGLGAWGGEAASPRGSGSTQDGPSHMDPFSPSKFQTTPSNTIQGSNLQPRTLTTVVIHKCRTSTDLFWVPSYYGFASQLLSFSFKRDPKPKKTSRYFRGCFMVMDNGI